MKPKRRHNKKINYIYYTIRYSRVFHREDGPALIFPNNSVEWYRYGERHRLDGPAVEYFDGYQEWYKYGLLHREGGPAITDILGLEEWYINGKPHRIGGPARIYSDGREEWCVDGWRHRVDGPAIKDGELQLFFLNGRYFPSKEAWFEALTPDQQQKMLFSEYFVN